MKIQRISAMAFSVFLLSCATRPQKAPSPDIIMNQQLLKQHPEESSFWLIYALGEISCLDQYPEFTFGHFSCAFKTAMGVNAKKDNNKADKDGNSRVKSAGKPAENRTGKSEFLTELDQVMQADLVNEYLFYRFRQKDWFLEPGLKTSTYRAWARTHLKNKQQVTIGAAVKNLHYDVDETRLKQIKLSDQFIKNIGNLHFERIHVYDEKSLGISIRYRITSNVNGWIDFYIYPKLRPPVKNSTRSPLIDEATIAKNAILYYAERSGAQQMKVLEETVNPDTHLLRGRYQLAREGNLYIDELLLSDNEHYFLKARSSYLQSQREYQDKEVQAIFASLLKNIQQ